MADTSNTPTAMTAGIDLVIDKQKLQREINGAAHTVQQGLNKVGNAAGKQASRAISQTVSEVAGKMKEASDKLSAVLQVPMKFGLAAGGSAIAAFLRSNTAEANQFKARLSEVQTALGGVGQKLAMNVKFGGRSAYEWAEKLAKYLNNLDTNQLQKAADIITKIAIAVAGMKGFSLGADLVKSGAEITRMMATLNAARGGGALLTGFGAAGGAALGAGAVGGGFASARSAKLAAASAKAAANALVIDQINALATVSGAAPLIPVAAAGVAGVSSKSTLAARTGFAYGKLGARGVGSAALTKVSGYSIESLNKAIGPAAVGLIKFNLALELATRGVKTGIASYKKEQGWLKEATGQGMFSLGGGDKISTWKAVTTEGLHTDNWFDRMFRGSNPFVNETSYSAEETQAALAENARQRTAQRRGIQNSGLYRQQSRFGASMNDRMQMFGRIDARRETDATYTDLKKRIPELELMGSEADNLALRFKTLRDTFAVGTQSWVDNNNAFVDATTRATVALGAVADIEKLRIAEEKQRIGARKNIAELRSDYAESADESLTRKNKALAGYTKQEAELKESFDRATKGGSSISLGLAANQLQAYQAQRIQGAQSKQDALAELNSDYLKTLAEIAEDRKDTEDEFYKDYAKRAKVLDDNIKKITESVTGSTTGTPAE